MNINVLVVSEATEKRCQNDNMTVRVCYVENMNATDVVLKLSYRQQIARHCDISCTHKVTTVLK